MRDGLTIRIERSEEQDCFSEFLDRWHPSLVVLSGGAAGTEHVLDRETTVLGRGPGVDLILQDPEVSQKHARIDFTDAGFRVMDLGSTNGTILNGKVIHVGDLENGDRLRLGSFEIQFVLEKRPGSPPVYTVLDG